MWRGIDHVFLVMPFGLTNASTTFCNLINDVLYEFLNDIVVVYLDNIMVFSTSMEDYVVHLSKVLNGLREHKLFVKKEKCEFACDEIMFLGYLVSIGQVRMDPKKVQNILEWVASIVSDLRSFSSLENKYCWFIKGYNKVVTPLSNMLKRNWR
jgi:hypothetical protein